MTKLDVYSVDDALVSAVAPDVFTVGEKVFSVRMGSFAISYPLAEPHFRVVLGILRADDDPMHILGVSIVYVIFTYREGTPVPQRVGITYLPDKYGRKSTAVVVDGFPVYISNRSVVDLKKVREFISRYKLLSSA